MRILDKLRHSWHDLYYSIAPEGGVKFAMNCKEATAHIDLGTHQDTRWARLRLKLHLSLCQACKNYSDLSNALKKAIVGFAHASALPLDLDQMNQNLLKKYARK
jgi:hypothetical protein